MKASIAILFLAFASVAALEPLPDLTGKGDKVFREHVGKHVALRGRLEVGKEGWCLHGATGKDVVFYILPEKMKTGAADKAAEDWNRLLHQQVQVAGALKFQSFPKVKQEGKPLMQTPPDYYYMALQGTRLEAVTGK